MRRAPENSYGTVRGGERKYKNWVEGGGGAQKADEGHCKEPRVTRDTGIK